MCTSHGESQALYQDPRENDECELEEILSKGFFSWVLRRCFLSAANEECWGFVLIIPAVFMIDSTLLS